MRKFLLNTPVAPVYDPLIVGTLSCHEHPESGTGRAVSVAVHWQSASTPSVRRHQPSAVHQWSEDSTVRPCLLAKGAFENIRLEGAIKIDIYYYYYYYYFHDFCIIFSASNKSQLSIYLSIYIRSLGSVAQTATANVNPIGLMRRSLAKCRISDQLVS